MANEIDSSHLHSFIGKDVRMFRGGPESRSGKLLDVRSDFITLDTEEEGVVHYNLNHIKSAWRNAQNNNLLDEQISGGQSNYNLDRSINSFQELLRSLIEHPIQIDRGGPESRKGRLLDVKSDFLILDTDQDGVVFYKIQHIKSISDSSEDTNQKNKDSKDEKARVLMLRNLASVDSFNDLLKKLRYNWVKVNRGGPESVEGIMADLSDECLILTVHHEVNYMQIFHIRNISVNLKSKNDQSKNDKEDSKKGEDTGAADKKDSKGDKKEQEKKKGDGGGKKDKKDDPKQSDEKGKETKDKKEPRNKSGSGRDSGKNDAKKNESSGDQEKRKSEREKNKDHNPPAKPWVTVLSRR